MTTAEIRRLRMMMLIRRFEERVVQEYCLPGQLIGGFVHVYSGQEAIAVGASEVFRHGLDTYVGSFRCHGWSLALGMSLRAAAGELFGRETGCCGGRVGSMHFTDRAHDNLGAWHTVGAQVPVGIGAAFAAAYRRTGGATFVVFGDGALGQGVTFEAMNLASLLKLPVVFLCEDNGVAMGTKVERHSAEADLMKRGSGTPMPCRAFDGNDVDVVMREVGEAAERARSGGGPSYLVAKTYRFRGFSMSDPMKYRTVHEQEAARLRDPVVLYKRQLIEKGLLDQDGFEELEEAVVVEVQSAIDFARDDPHPPVESRSDDVLAEKYPYSP